MSNQTTIPYIQSQDMNLNQTQQNVNRVFNNLNNQIISNTNAINQMTILGEIKFSPISIAEFQSMAGTTWILANGQSAVGTDYALEFSVTTVPNITVTGTNAFIKVNL